MSSRIDGGRLVAVRLTKTDWTQDAEVVTAAIELGDDALGALLTRQGRPSLGRAAVTDHAGTLDGAEFRRRVAGLASQLRSLGVERGAAVALWLPNSAAYLLAIFAIARLGALAVHVNTRFGDAEVGDVLRRTRASVLILRAGFAAVDVVSILAKVGETDVRAVLCEDADNAPPRLLGLPVTPLDYAGECEDVGRGSDPCLTYTTSGTTAKPKLVVHTQRSIAVHARQVARRLGLERPNDAYLAAVPFCGTFGNCAAMAAMGAGAHVICMDAFDPNAADVLIRRHRVTHAVGDDRMLGRLASVALDGEGPHTTVRFFGVAAFHPDAEASCARGAQAGLAPHAIYGSSEVQALFALGRAAETGGGPVTPTSPDARVEIAGAAGDPDRGELLLAGPSLFDGYLDDPQASAAALTPQGLFRTGDVAARAADGFVFEGRMGDVLRLGGFLVNPAEIEAFLQAQPGVAAAAVVGVEDGGRPVAFAFVVAEPNAEVEEAALLASCRRHLARYKAPVRAVTVDAFPYSQGPNGPKIARAALRTSALRMLEEAAATPASERMRI